jgi:hypothetical protein
LVIGRVNTLHQEIAKGTWVPGNAKAMKIHMRLLSHGHILLFGKNVLFTLEKASK